MTVTVADVLVSRIFQELGGPVTFWFNKALGRYVNASTGRMVSEKKVLQIGEKFTQQFTRPRIEALTEKFISGSIDLATWQERMALELKNSYIVNMALGKGGRKNIDFSDWGRIGGRLKFEYSHLDGFAYEISTGQLSEAQIRARAALYADGARTAYYDGRTAAMKDAEFDLERRVLGVAEHCFPPGTLISTPIGEKKIEELNIGDYVSTLDGDKKISRVYCRQYNNGFVQVSANSKTVICTPNHPFLTKRGWIEAGKLIGSDQIMLFQDGFYPIESKLFFPHSDNRVATGGQIGITRVVSRFLGKLPIIQRFKSWMPMPPVSIGFDDQFISNQGVHNEFGLDKVMMLKSHAKTGENIEEFKFELARPIFLQLSMPFHKSLEYIRLLLHVFERCIAQSLGSTWLSRRIICSHVFSGLGINEFCDGLSVHLHTNFIGATNDGFARPFTKDDTNGICPARWIMFADNVVLFTTPIPTARVVNCTKLGFSIPGFPTNRAGLKRVFFGSTPETNGLISILSMTTDWACLFPASLRLKFANIYIAATNRAKSLLLFAHKFIMTGFANMVLHRRSAPYRLYHDDRKVYNLEVEDVHHYVANGFVVHNCDDCVGYAEQGWVPIGTLPEPGEGSVCNNNCQCEKEYASSAEMNGGEMSFTFDLSDNPCGRQLTRSDLVGSDNLGYLCRHCGWPVEWEKGVYRHGEA